MTDLLTAMATPAWAYLALFGLLAVDAMAPVVPTQAIMMPPSSGRYDAFSKKKDHFSRDDPSIASFARSTTSVTMPTSMQAAPTTWKTMSWRLRYKMSLPTSIVSMPGEISAAASSQEC